jgi:class 3 adenylate cyclase
MRNFTAIGDTTNLAARLQTFAEPGRVVIGEATYAQIADVARVRLLGTPELKGKSDPVAAYELLGLDRAPIDPSEAVPDLASVAARPSNARP